MTQRSGLWNGASLGDANLLTEVAADGIGYRLGNADYESHFVDRFSRMLWNGDENRGVLRNLGNELIVAGVGSPITVDTGGAIVYGMPYENTVSVNVVVPNPTNDTRYDYIVLRRDWAAQTIRITRIPGVESGSIPALVQSPSPTGSGIYDVPLATLSITTGGVIAVTDAREFCIFGTGIADDALATAHLNNDSVDWLDRATRTKTLFLGGGDLQPINNAGRFQYTNGGSYATMTGVPPWNGAANEEGWQITGNTYEGVQAACYLPDDWAGGSLSTYIWWVCNNAIVQSIYIRSAGQLYALNTGASGDTVDMITYSSVSITSTPAVSDVFRTAGITMAGSYFTPGASAFSVKPVIYLAAYWYNSAGAEDISILGIEIEYTGYT